MSDAKVETVSPMFGAAAHQLFQFCGHGHGPLSGTGNAIDIYYHCILTQNLGEFVKGDYFSDIKIWYREGAMVLYRGPQNEVGRFALVYVERNPDVVAKTETVQSRGPKLFHGLGDYLSSCIDEAHNYYIEPEQFTAEINKWLVAWNVRMVSPGEKLDSSQPTQGVSEHTFGKYLASIDPTADRALIDRQMNVWLHANELEIRKKQ